MLNLCFHKLKPTNAVQVKFILCQKSNTQQTGMLHSKHHHLSSLSSNWLMSLTTATNGKPSSSANHMVLLQGKSVLTILHPRLRFPSPKSQGNSGGGGATGSQLGNLNAKNFNSPSRKGLFFNTVILVFIKCSG